MRPIVDDDNPNPHLVDIDRLIQEVVDSGLDPSVFDVDLDVEYAKNVIEFAISPEFMKTSLWAKQAEQAVRLFAEYCPTCTDMDYFDDVPVDSTMGVFKSKVVLLEHGICPECSKNKKELFDELPFELVSCLGQRSGKTALVGGTLAPYYVHRFLQLPSPSRYYGLLTSSYFQMTFVAVTAGQAYESVWMAFKGALQNSPWFETYISKLQALEKEKNLEKGSLIKVLETGIIFGNKRLACSYAAADMKSLRGRTRVFCVSRDTTIVTDQGLVAAKDISSLENAKFLTKNHGFQPVTESFNRTVDTFKVVTKSGYEITGSEEHPLLIAMPDSSLVYKPIKELRSDDVLVISRDENQLPLKREPITLPSVTKNGTRGHNNKRYNPPTHMSEDLAYLLGILAAEGYLSKKVTRWHTSDKEILDRSVSAFESVFGKKPNVRHHESLKDNWSPGWNIEVQSPIVHEFLKLVGLFGKSDTKTVPWCILRSDQQCASQFLAGYFDGDGNVDRGVITAHSKSTSLLKEVQCLLLTMGIVSKRSHYTRKIKSKEEEVGAYSKIQIFGTNAELFHKRVLLISRKVPCPLTESPSINVDRVYLDLGLLKTTCVDTNKYLWYARKKQNNVYFSIVENTLPVLEKQHPTIASNLSSFLKENLFFDEIDLIESVGEQEVFDWTVDVAHNFIGNGIIQHNSGIDELGWFNSSDSKRANPDETYAALSNSLRTVRSAADVLWKRGDYNALPGYMLNFSSPSSQYDKIMRLLKDGEKDPRKICFHMSSWEASPLITRESLRSEETTDKVKFWRDFGAIPPLALDPFIESEEAIRAMQLPSPPPIKWRAKKIADKINKDMKYITAELVGALNDRITPRIIAVDGGEKQNSFAIGVFRMVPSPDGFTIIQDAIIEAKPEKDPDGKVTPVHFPSMFDIVVQLCDRYRGLNVLSVVYDRWQSTGEVQRLREMKINAERYSPKEADFNTLRNLVYSGNFKTPRWEHKSFADLDISNVEEVRKAPYTHQAIQFATVRSVGKKIVKPDVGEDDLFRVCVLAVRHLIENKKKFMSSLKGGQHVRGSMGSVVTKSNSSSYQGLRAKTSIGAVRGKFRKY